MKEEKRIYITKGTGCPRRGLDASKISNYFEANGWKIIEDPKKAEKIVLFTCSFKKSKEDKSIELVKKYEKYNAEVIVLGCLPGISEKRLKKNFSGRYLSTRNLEKIDNFFPDFKVKFNEIPDANNEFKEPNNNSKCLKEYLKIVPWLREIYSKIRRKNNKKTTNNNNNNNNGAILRIARGCLGNCSYCVIRHATGRLKSKPLQECLEEYKNLLKKGYRKFRIDGEDIGPYGLDIGSSLPDLLSEMSKVSRGLNVRWHIQTLHPSYAIKYKNSLLKHIRNGELKSLKCDLQSGNQRILNLMNRDYNIEEIISVLKELKREKPDINIKTHFIVGFPSEKESEFKDTVKAIDELMPIRVQVYQYSDMRGSISYEMSDKISEKTKKERREYIKNYFKNKGIKVIVEEESKGTKINI